MIIKRDNLNKMHWNVSELGVEVCKGYWQFSYMYNIYFNNYPSLGYDSKEIIIFTQQAQ